jgi:hypothetical protein
MPNARGRITFTTERPDHPWDDPDGDGHNCVTCVEQNSLWRCDKDDHPAWVIYGETKTALYCRAHKHFIPEFPCSVSIRPPS